MSLSNTSSLNRRIEDDSADCLMAFDTIACSWADVKVHFATSSVYPFHFGEGDWKLGDGEGLVNRGGGGSRRSRGSETTFVPEMDENDPRRGPGELFD
jgi:hypothetical protein